MTEQAIPRGAGGTLATLTTIASLAYAGAQYPELRRFAGTISPRSVDTVLRNVWKFVSDGEHETVRSIPRLMDDFLKYGTFFGDCDDAAVLSAALLLTWPFMVHASLDAMRSPASPAFEHVFVSAEDGLGVFRIDPTAPRDADYTNWERLSLPLF